MPRLLSSSIFGMLRGWSRVAPTGRGGYRLARLARRSLPRDQWSGQFRTPSGARLQLDLGTYPDCCMAVGIYELDTARVIRRWLRSGGWFVDCGANIGYFTLLAAACVGKNGRVDAFEPDPINRRRLEEHLAANGPLPQVRVHPQAVGRRADKVELFHPTGDEWNHGMATTCCGLAPGSADTFVVDVVRLDEALEGVPDLIKLDVEGAELAAIEGAARLLSSPSPPAIIFEHNPVTSAAAGYRPSEIMRRLMELCPRFRLFEIDWRLRRIRLAEQLDGLKRECNVLAYASGKP